MTFNKEIRAFAAKKESLLMFQIKIVVPMLMVLGLYQFGLLLFVSGRAGARRDVIAAQIAAVGCALCTEAIWLTVSAFLQLRQIPARLDRVAGYCPFDGDLQKQALLYAKRRAFFVSGANSVTRDARIRFRREEELRLVRSDLNFFELLPS